MESALEITRTASERLSVKRLLEALAVLDESEAKTGRVDGWGRSRPGVEEASDARLRRMNERVVGPPRGAA
jgi:hypothetical protein